MGPFRGPKGFLGKAGPTPILSPGAFVGVVPFGFGGQKTKIFPRAFGIIPFFRRERKALSKGNFSKRLKLWGNLGQIPNFPTCGFQPFSTGGFGGPLFLFRVRKNSPRDPFLWENHLFFPRGPVKILGWVWAKPKKPTRVYPSRGGCGFGPGIQKAYPTSPFFPEGETWVFHRRKGRFPHILRGLSSSGEPRSFGAPPL